MSESTWIPIRELVQRYADGALSAAETIESGFRRVHATEPRIRAFTTLMFESAMEAAERADAAAGRGDLLGPLHGVPVAIKDLVSTAGYPTEAGSKVLEGFIPSEDATVVKRLRRAGAIIIGKSVTHEFAYGRNVVDTRNAWDPSCYSGGSSAGSAVAVAVGSAHGAIGTDTGGSIRVPASMNGVVGLKPTYGLVSRDGVIPLSASMDVVGPMARMVEDCAVLLEAMAGADGPDTGALGERAPGSPDPLEGTLNGMRVGVDRHHFFYPGVEQPVATAVESAVELLEDMGVRVVPVRVPHIESSMATGLATMVPEASEWHRSNLHRRGNRYVQATRTMLQVGELLPAASYIKAQKVRALVRDGIRSVFEEEKLDALVGPTIPVTTMPLDEWRVSTNRLGETPIASCMHHGMVANVTGLPSLSVPVGFDGMHPIGMQLIGRPFSEDVLFRLGHGYQQATDWHERHPGWVDSD